MPTPVGHLLAGVAVAWTIAPRADRRLTLAAAGLAAAPDLDLLLPFQHRTITHNVLTAALVTILAAVVTRQVTPRARARIAAICGLAVASHLLLDWLGTDRVLPYGLQALWPFSERFYISGLDWFRGTARTNIFGREAIVRNLAAIAQEIAIMGPIVWGIWLVRVKTAARLPSEVTGSYHPTQ